MVSNCRFFWVDILDGCENYQLTDCIISGNDHYLGNWNMDIGDLEESEENIFTEKNIVKKGAIEHVKGKNAKTPKNNLHILPSGASVPLVSKTFQE